MTKTQETPGNGNSAQKRRRLGTAIATIALSAGLLSAPVGAQRSAQTEKSFALDIPAKPLSAALVDLGLQTNLSVGYASGDFGAVVSQPLMGTYTLEEALDRILVDTNLSYYFVTEDTVRIVSAAADSSSMLDGESDDDFPAAASSETTRRWADEVVVTAQKREESLQDVPLSVSAVTEERIEFLGLDGLGDLAPLIPNVQFQTSAGGTNRVTIRGVSTLTGEGTRIGVYLDEMPIGVSSFEVPELTTFDVERIEVLRGPQGTLHGEGSLGGTMRIITNKADPESFDVKANATYSGTRGGEAGFGANVMVNLPLVSDKLALRVIASHRRDGGYIDNPVRGEDDVNRIETTAIRAAARWFITEDLTADFTFIHNESESDGISISNDDFEQFNPLREVRSDQFNLYNATFSYELPWADFVSSTGYFDRDIEKYILDFSSIAPLVTFLTGIPISSAGLDRPKTEQVFTQEVRLVSRDSAPWTWTVGGFFKSFDKRTINLTVTDPVVPPDLLLVNDVDQQFTQYALFGEVSYDVTDRFNALFGLRLFREKRESRADVSGILPLILGGVSDITFDSDDADNVVNPKVTLSYDVSDEAMVYATAARGFRGGGINPFWVLFPDAPISVDAETLWNYEIGAKTAWLDNRLIVNGAAYYIDWDNLQSNAPVTNDFFGYLINSGAARSLGVELEVTAYPTENLELFLSGAYTDAELRETTPEGMAGDPLPLVPDHKLYASAIYRFPIAGSIEGSFQFDWSRVGGSFSGLGRVRPNEAYSQFNTRLGLTSDHWQIFIFGENLADKRGQVRRLPQGDVLTRPRTFGVKVQASL